jgi:hypothetical protein
MALIDTLIGPIASIIDKIIPHKEAQAKGKLELIALEGAQEMSMIEAQLQAIVAEANSKEPRTSRARPSFLYVMYIVLLTALPNCNANSLTVRSSCKRRSAKRALGRCQNWKRRLDTRRSA